MPRLTSMEEPAMKSRKKSAMNDPVDAAQLYEHLQAVIRDSEALLKATAAYAGDKVEGARAQVQASLQSAKERLAGVQDTVISQARDFVSTGTDYVSDNPWKSVGIAAAVG